MQAISKGEFAQALGVSAGRISQMIREGKIGPEALEGEGRFAKIRPDVARRQIADRTDIGQRFGNGLDTRLDAPAPDTGRVNPPPTDPTAELIKAERLHSLQLANQRAREEALARAGRYTRTDEVAAQMGKLASGMITVFEGALGDLAEDLASKFELPARDVLHALRQSFREVRVKAAAQARGHLAETPRLTEDVQLDASDPAAGEA
jgi:hypothetical protein